MKSVLSGPALSYLRYLSRRALKRHKPKIIGVAGSVGKSSAVHAIEAVLSDHYNTQTVGNSETGIPLGTLGMEPKNYTGIDWAAMLAKAPFNLDFLKHTEYLIVEMGIDDPDPPKNMDYLLTILKPHIAVSLNVSATHSMQFDKTVPSEITGEKRLNEVIKNIAKEDTKIITKSGCRTAIYNSDDEFIEEEIEKFKTKNTETKFVSFGSKNKNSISYGIYSVNLEGSYFQLFVEIEGKKSELKLKFKNLVLPEIYREIFAAGILVGLEAGLDLEKIKTSLTKNFDLPKGRAGFFKGVNNSYIIDSSYNAAKEPTIEFLKLLDKLENETNRKTVFVFGDMRELGDEAKIEHEKVALRTIGTVDYLYLVGPQTMEFVLPIVQEHEGKFKEIRWFENAIYAGKHLADNMPDQSIVLVKGSQNTIFLEETVKLILANKSESKKLCRQTKYWLNLKKNYYKKVS